VPIITADAEDVDENVVDYVAAPDEEKS
jgi:hypothetical protein